ncbi:SAM-dependent methyltransferase [Nocardia bovistercoris]|uniref:SAM-dependent methyltransferase n=1 Tax=Nocardia bovistercoris TaxID=2785916 RepID=A0A931IIW5_9NOCA|nr:SAM-dependent methyltransferase [Nocardia bovistercoris]MBH0781141.1 SAM-dependent methyltransferase [Nocardia bovistercoris]
MTEEFVPRETDPRVPSSARIYHYYLTSEPVFDSDAVFAERMFEIVPWADEWAHHNRNFLRRAVSFMAEQGIRQFLDIGSGLPTGGNTHDIARAIDPKSRVVYVDLDLEAVDRAHDLLAAQDVLDTTAVIEGDLRTPQHLLDHPDTRRLLDFSEPIGLLIVSVLPFVPDEDRPGELIAHLRDQLPSGSYVALSHASMAEAPAEILDKLQEANTLYQQTSDPITSRNREEFTRLLDGFELVEPGVVFAPDWRPDEKGAVDPQDPARRCNFAAIGRKPTTADQGS